MDDLLLAEYFEKFKALIEAQGESLALPPMNSYQRRLIHKLAGDFNLKTSSEGEGDRRHIVITITEQTTIPSEEVTKAVAASATSTPRAARPEHKTREIMWSFGDREFYVNPLEPNVEIILTKDGTVALWQEESPQDYLDKRSVTTGSFKVKQNKITLITDPNW